MLVIISHIRWLWSHIGTSFVPFQEVPPFHVRPPTLFDASTSFKFSLEFQLPFDLSLFTSIPIFSPWPLPSMPHLFRLSSLFVKCEYRYSISYKSSCHCLPTCLIHPHPSFFPPLFAFLQLPHWKLSPLSPYNILFSPHYLTLVITVLVYSILTPESYHRSLLPYSLYCRYTTQVCLLSPLQCAIATPVL